jgi:hypothetical protein
MSRRFSRTCENARLPWATGLCHKKNVPDQRLKLTGTALSVLQRVHLPSRPRQLSGTVRPTKSYVRIIVNGAGIAGPTLRAFGSAK